MNKLRVCAKRNGLSVTPSPGANHSTQIFFNKLGMLTFCHRRDRSIIFLLKFRVCGKDR